MTAVALLRSWNMGSRQADGLHGVVAARTPGREDRGVLEARRRPCVGGMTGFAGGIARYVCRWLAPSGPPVMTACTRALHLGVVDCADRQPGQCCVTRLAV